MELNSKKLERTSRKTSRISLDTLAYDDDARRRFASAITRLPRPTSLEELRDVALLPGFAAPTLRTTPPWHMRARGPLLPPSELEARELAAHTTHVLQYTRKLSRNPWGAWRHVIAMMRAPVPLKGSLTAALLHEHFAKAMEVNVPFDPGGIPSVLFPHVVHISDADFTLAELERAVFGMTNHTAPGPDGIPIEAFRCGAFRERALPLLNKALDPAILPPALTRGLLTPLFKGKGDAADPSGYRPVVLLPVLAKVLHKMILHRVRDALDKYLLPVQAAYRPHRSTIQHIATLHELTSRARSSNTPLYVTFADFTNAFSSVRRAALFAILRGYGVPSRLVEYLERFHDQHRLHVRFNGRVHEAGIVPTVGVLQGDTLAPYLFILVMDQILRRIPEARGAIADAPRGLRIAALAYADDVVLRSGQVSVNREPTRDLTIVVSPGDVTGQRHLEHVPAHELRQGLTRAP